MLVELCTGIMPANPCALAGYIDIYRLLYHLFVSGIRPPWIKGTIGSQALRMHGMNWRYLYAGS